MWEEDVREATPKDTINHVVCGRAMLWLPILARLSALPEPAQLALCRSQRAQPIHQKSYALVRNFESQYGHCDRMSKARPCCEGYQAAMREWIPHRDAEPH
jgi:hypothetical protein